MGLDTSHNAWHGSYTGFSHWRQVIANAAGWSLSLDQYYSIPEGRIPNQDPPLDEVYTVDGETDIVRWSEHYDNSVWLGQWDNDPEDAIDVLLIHSDCEGIIPWRFTQPLADRLTELLPLLKSLDEDVDEDWWRDITIQFITGLITAHYRHEDVEFF